MDCSPPGSSVYGILQARILEWLAISYSRQSPWPRDWTHVSCVSCIADGCFTAEPPGKTMSYQKKKKKHKNFLLKNYLLNFHLKPNPTKVHTSIEDCMQLQHFSNILSGSLGERSLQICLSLLSGSHLLFCTSVSLLFKVTEFLKKWLSYEDNATLEM